MYFRMRTEAFYEQKSKIVKIHLYTIILFNVAHSYDNFKGIYILSIF